jgi:hypothetical protein
LAEAKRLRQQQEENYQKRTLEKGRRTMEKVSLKSGSVGFNPHH